MQTFNSSKYYNGNLNGFDIMLMESDKNANKIIQQLKNIIDLYPAGTDYSTIDLVYNDENLTELDKKRVQTVIKKYILEKITGCV
jgi:hypothetical protein